ncbi:MAG: substrate-binding domain-containing protein [Nitrospirota bacterium]
MRRSKHIALAAAVIVLSVAAGTAAAGQVQLSGSTTFQKRVLDPSQKLLEKKTGIICQVTAAGTVRGLKDLMKGEASAAIIACPLDAALLETGIPPEGTYQEHVIMQDQVVAIVNASNKVKGLTLSQLADIHSGKIANWKDVGGPDDRIVVVVPPASSGTRAFLKDMVMKGAAIATSAYTTVTDREAIDIVGKSPIAIALLSEGFVKGNGKQLKVVKTPAMKRPLSIITRDEPSADLKAIIKFLKSSEAKKLFL